MTLGKDTLQLSPDPNLLFDALERGKEIKGAPFELKRESDGQVIARGLNQEDCQEKLRLFNSLPTTVTDPATGADTPNMAWMNARDAVVTGLTPTQCAELRMIGKTDLIELVAKDGYEAVKHLTDPFELTMEHKLITNAMDGDKTDQS